MLKATNLFLQYLTVTFRLTHKKIDPHNKLINLMIILKTDYQITNSYIQNSDEESTNQYFYD